MKNFHILSNLFNGQWYLSADFIRGCTPIVMSLMDGGDVPASKEVNEADDVMAGAVSFLGVSGEALDVSGFAELEDAATMVVNIEGALLRNDHCGSAGYFTMKGWIEAADKNEHVSGVVLDINSPGGMVSGLAILADAIGDFKKPIYSMVQSGMAASAAYFIASQTDGIFVSHKDCWVGSIGTMAKLTDFRGALEMNGLKEHVIYAPQSIDKNKDYENAMDGDYSEMQRMLGVSCDVFIDYVKDGRGDKIVENENPFTGKMYTAADALRIGLIDGVMGMNELLDTMKYGKMEGLYV